MYMHSYVHVIQSYVHTWTYVHMNAFTWTYVHMIACTSCIYAYVCTPMKECMHEKMHHMFICPCIRVCTTHTRKHTHILFLYVTVLEVLKQSQQYVDVSCSKMQWVAVSCSELRWVAVSCSELHVLVCLVLCVFHTRTSFVLPHTATHYNTLQHTATHCNTLQWAALIHTMVFGFTQEPKTIVSTRAAHCSVLQCVAVCCSVL